MNMPACSFIFPIHNEKHTVIRNLALLCRLLESELNGLSYEVLLVDNGSSDHLESAPELIELVESCPQVALYQLPNKGRGYALNYGFRQARAPLICILSIDRAWGEDFVGRALTLCDEGVDIVYGSKSHPNSDIDRPLKRRVASLIVRGLVCLLFRVKPADTQSVKMFRAASIPFLQQLKSYNYFAETEFYLRAGREQLRMVTIPVTVCDRRRDSSVKVSSFFMFLAEAIHFYRHVWIRLKATRKQPLPAA